MPKESFEVRVFLRCWVWRWDREDLHHHHHQCRGEGWICSGWFDPGHPTHSQGGFWTLFSSQTIFDCSQRALPLKWFLSGSLKWWSGCWSPRCPSWEPRRSSRLWSASPSSWHFTTSTKKRFLHQSPKIFPHCLWNRLKICLFRCLWLLQPSRVLVDTEDLPFLIFPFIPLLFLFFKLFPIQLLLQ